MVCLTTLNQAFSMVICARVAEWRAARSVRRQHEFRKALAISLLTAWLLIGVKVLAWAAVYLALPEITNADLSGVPPYEIAIAVSESTLEKYGFTIAGIAAAVRDSSINLPAGGIRTL